MANLKNVIYLSNEDYETLVSTGTITIDGETLTYDENNVYITPDKLASSTEDGLMSSSDKVKLDTITGVTTSVASGSSDLVTSGAVYTAINNLPAPMIYKGTLGTGGTITALPTASSSNEGFTYKVITDGTYASQSAKVGDVFISNGSAWTLVPAGDDVEDTWRQINVNGTQLLGTGISTGAVNFKNGSNVTITGSGNDITISASQPTVNNGTLTIQKNGTNVQTFTANQSSNVTANISVPTKTSELTNDSGYVKSSGVTSVTTSGTGISGGTITSTGTITLDSSSAGNAAANKVVIRNAAGSIQTEKLAVSSGTTTKSILQYNLNESIDETILKSTTNTYTLAGIVAPDTAPKEATLFLKVPNSGSSSNESYFMDISVMNYQNPDEEPEESIYIQSKDASVKPNFNIGYTDETQTRHKKFIVTHDALPIMLKSTGIWIKNTNDKSVHGWADRTELSLAELQQIKNISSKVDSMSDNSTPHLYAYGKYEGSAINHLDIATTYTEFTNTNNYGRIPNIAALKEAVVRLEPDGASQNYDKGVYQLYGHMPLSTAQSHRYAMEYCFNISNTPNATYIPQYNEAGRLQSNEPYFSSDVATKNYTDTTIETTINSKFRGSIAPEYSSSSTYAIGDKVMHNGQLYTCAKAITRAEAWNVGYWAASKVSSSFVDLDTTQTISGVKTFSTQQKFTVANGTSPFTVTSSTKVDNLNADKLDGNDSSYYLNYNNLTNKPTIPTVNNGTLTIQKNGTNIQTFTANQSSNVTANISVPTKVTDLIDASNYLNISAIAQAKSGNLTLTGNTYIGDGTTSSRAVGDAPYQTKFLDFDRRTGVLKHLNVFSGVGDYFYNADRKRTFIIRSTFKGNGLDSDTYKADFYTWGVDDMGSSITYLFDWDLNYGWCVLPSKVSTSTPAIIEIKCGSRISYTDVLRLALTGHNGYDRSNNYSGTLTDYTIEVCTDYTNDTWVTVVDRSNVVDKIGLCPQYSLQTGNYTACFGIRLTITGCSVTGNGNPYIKITSMQLRDHRPGFTIPSSVGALSERGGNIYGDIILDARGSEQTVKPAINDTGYLGGSSNKWHALYTTNVYADSVTTNGINSTDNIISLNVTSSTGLIRVADFSEDSTGETQIVAYGHLAAFGDNDSSNPLKPTDQTSFSDLDAYYFNTGITLYNSDDETTYKLSFPGKSGVLATISDVTTISGAEAINNKIAALEEKVATLETVVFGGNYTVTLTINAVTDSSYQQSGYYDITFNLKDGTTSSVTLYVPLPHQASNSVTKNNVQSFLVTPHLNDFGYPSSSNMTGRVYYSGTIIDTPYTILGQAAETRKFIPLEDVSVEITWEV